MDCDKLWREWTEIVSYTKSPPVEWELTVDDLFEEMDGYAVILSYYWNSMTLPTEWGMSEEEVNVWLKRVATSLQVLYPDATVEPYIVFGEGYRAIGVELTR
jgi:hypothetical protein